MTTYLICLTTDWLFVELIRCLHATTTHTQSNHVMMINDVNNFKSMGNNNKSAIQWVQCPHRYSALGTNAASATATKTVHQLQVCSIVHNYGTPAIILQSYIRVCAVLWECGKGQTNRKNKQMAMTNIHFTSATATPQNVITIQQQHHSIQMSDGKWIRDEVA